MLEKPSSEFMDLARTAMEQRTPVFYQKLSDALLTEAVEVGEKKEQIQGVNPPKR